MPLTPLLHIHTTHRWLRARGWDVDRTFKAICKHSDWRIAMMPNGRIEEVCCVFDCVHVLSCLTVCFGLLFVYVRVCAVCLTVCFAASHIAST